MTIIEQIPRKIHQIWSGVDEPLPKQLAVWGDTWKLKHPNWEFEFWDNNRMNAFVINNFPQYWDRYNQFKHNIQKWDAIRYLIIYKLGGVYVDYDYECLKSIDKLIEMKTCCFPMEPIQHAAYFARNTYINNALIASVPGHQFIKVIIEQVFENEQIHKWDDMRIEILSTTGPLMLSDIYEKYNDKKSVYLIPPNYVSPLSKPQARAYLSGYNENEFKNILEQAYAVHYFLGTWA